MAKVFGINQAMLEVLTDKEAKVILAALKVRNAIPDTSRYTPKCVRELKSAVDALGPSYFVVEDSHASSD